MKLLLTVLTLTIFTLLFGFLTLTRVVLPFDQTVTELAKVGTASLIAFVAATFLTVPFLLAGPNEG